jgi:hypothetical protein
MKDVTFLSESSQISVSWSDISSSVVNTTSLNLEEDKWQETASSPKNQDIIQVSVALLPMTPAR